MPPVHHDILISQPFRLWLRLTLVPNPRCGQCDKKKPLSVETIATKSNGGALASGHVTAALEFCPVSARHAAWNPAGYPLRSPEPLKFRFSQGLRSP